MARRATHHPVTHKLNFSNHRMMAAYWGEEAIRAMRRAIADPTPATIEDLYLHHAVRATRVAVYHALKVIGRKS